MSNGLLNVFKQTPLNCHLKLLAAIVGTTQIYKRLMTLPPPPAPRLFPRRAAQNKEYKSDAACYGQKHDSARPPAWATEPPRRARQNSKKKNENNSQTFWGGGVSFPWCSRLIWKSNVGGEKWMDTLLDLIWREFWYKVRQIFPLFY